VTVTLEWVGHACFRIAPERGPVVVTDPYHPGDLGFPELDLDGDVVVVSSLDDTSHNNAGAVRGARVVNALAVARGEAEAAIDGEPVVAVAVRESSAHPTGAKDNAMYGFRVGELAFVHMGDAGAIGPADLEPFAGRCDVLLALTGGGLTVPLDEVDAAIETLRPAYVAPMHYSLPQMKDSVRDLMLPLEAFLERRAGDPLLRPGGTLVTLAAGVGASRPTIVVLEPSGVR
jgi:L-ascorbate metabolism protein UlaG (beta-lactamase superfamily)